MSAPLKDLRTAIDEPTHILLAAAAAARDTTIADVARGVLRDWAQREMAVAREIAKALPASGFDSYGEPIRKGAEK